MPRECGTTTRVSIALSVGSEEGGQILLGLARQEQHLLHAREVDRGSQHGVVEQGRALVLDLNDATDGQALGEETAHPGCDDEVSRRQLGAVPRHELQPYYPA